MMNIAHARPVNQKTLADYRTGQWTCIAKCRTIYLGKHNPNTKYTLPTDDGTIHEIAQTAEEKDLGVTMNNKLTFSRHI